MDVQTITEQVTTPSAAPASSPAAPAPTGAAPAAPAPAPAATTRPDWVGEQFWDGEKNSIKLDEFGKHYGEVAAFHKAEADRIAALPQKPEDYKFEIPKDVEIPDGMQFAVSEDNPSLVAFRKFAHEKKLSPDIAQGVYALYVADKAHESAVLRARVAEEVKKLGPNAPARGQAVLNFLVGRVGADHAKALLRNRFTADEMVAFEKLYESIANQGAAPVTPMPATPAAVPVKSTAEQIWPGGFQRKVG